MRPVETCTACDAETGRAGIAEDSLYIDGDGPFCERCYDERRDALQRQRRKVLVRIPGCVLGVRG